MQGKQLLVFAIITGGLCLVWKRASDGLDKMSQSKWWIYVAVLLIITIALWRKYTGKKGKWSALEANSFLSGKRNQVVDDLNVPIITTNLRQQNTESRGETACRAHLQFRFGVPFVKVRPSWLVNPKSSARLELDCYNDKLKLAVEYNGKQHYQYVERFHKSTLDLRNQKERDRIKRSVCRKRGIDLIEVPYTVEIEDIPNYIDVRLKKLGRI